MYDLVSDLPVPVMKKGASEFGKLKMFLLWLHAFEEPFYSFQNFRELARCKFFKEGKTRFVGVMLCLVLQK